MESWDNASYSREEVKVVNTENLAKLKNQNIKVNLVCLKYSRFMNAKKKRQKDARGIVRNTAGTKTT